MIELQPESHGRPVPSSGPGAMDAASVVDCQVLAYNARDADAFAATYADGARIFRARTGAVELAGRDAIRAHYGTVTFARSGLSAVVVDRMAVGNKLIVHERIVWDSLPAPMDAVVVYEVAGGLIQTAWLFETVPQENTPP
jgi:hypothetical protein